MFANTPFCVTSTTISGHHNTRESTIERRLQGVYAARTVAEVAGALTTASKELERMGCFESVSMTLADSDQDVTIDGCVPARLIVEIKEKRLVTAKATTFVEAGQGGVEVSGQLRNVLGRGETLEASLMAGGTEMSRRGAGPRRQQAKAEFSQPYLFGTSLTGVAAIDTGSQAPLGAPYTELSHGVEAGLYGGLVDLVWTARYRDVFPDRPMANPNESTPADSFAYDCPGELVRLARPSTKSTLSAIWKRNSMLPSPFNPRTGTFSMFKAEFSHPSATGGDVGLASIAVKHARFALLPSISPSLSAGISFEAAALQPLGGGDGFIPLVDRLYMGGPMSLWGFAYRGVGPRTSDGRASLGGSLKWASRLTINGPSLFPQAPDLFRTQVFLNVGALSNRGSLQALFKDDLRASLGVGISVPVAVGKVEINFSQPIRCSSTDELHPSRLQFGITAEM